MKAGGRFGSASVSFGSGLWDGVGGDSVERRSGAGEGSAERIGLDATGGDGLLEVALLALDFDLTRLDDAPDDEVLLVGDLRGRASSSAICALSSFICITVRSSTYQSAQPIS